MWTIHFKRNINLERLCNIDAASHSLRNAATGYCKGPIHTVQSSLLDLDSSFKVYTEFTEAASRNMGYADKPFGREFNPRRMYTFSTRVQHISSAQKFSGSVVYAISADNNGGVRVLRYLLLI